MARTTRLWQGTRYDWEAWIMKCIGRRSVEDYVSLQ